METMKTQQFFIIFTSAQENFHSIYFESATSKLCYYYIVLKKFVCRHNFTYLPLRKIYLIPQFKTIYIYSCLTDYTLSYMKHLLSCFHENLVCVSLSRINKRYMYNTNTWTPFKRWKYFNDQDIRCNFSSVDLCMIRWYYSWTPIGTTNMLAMLSMAFNLSVITKNQ